MPGAARRWPFVALLLGTGYACSGTPELVVRPGDVGSGGRAGGSSGGTGGKVSGGNGGSIGGAAGRIGTSGGAAGKSGNTGGKSGNTGGKSGNLGGSGGSDDSGGFGGFPDIDFDYDAGVMGQGGACERVMDEGTLVKRPMDVIVSIDNSASMEGEIVAVQERINDDFARILDASGIDYRVILVSRFGNVFISSYDGGVASDSQFSICVETPLSTLNCPDDDTEATPALSNNPPKFFHHSTDIGSNNMWCRLLESYDTADPYPVARAGFTSVAPDGWGAFLRPEAYKIFVGITDDSPGAASATYSHGGQTLARDCPNMLGDAGLDGTNDQAGANDFDAALRTLAPAQFGALGGDRNYSWYSIVGMAGGAPDATEPLTPTDPVETRCCRRDGSVDSPCQGSFGNRLNDAANNGVGYQYLSMLTGGLRYPSCYNDNFDAMFNAIAEGVIEGARTSCEYDVPIPTNGIVDFDQTVVSYLPMGNAAGAIELTRVAGDMACGNDPAYYFNPDFTKIFLCPNTCVTVQTDDLAEVSIDFGCLGS